MNDLFSGRTCAIATKHAKERVIAPVFSQRFGMQCVVPDIDTDILGTFSGEKPRQDDALTTLRKKAGLARELGYDMVIATEGSFGPHPMAYLLPAHEELMLFCDFKNDIELVERQVAMNPCFHGAFISTHDELRSFLDMIAFPDHAVILRKDEKSLNILHKGISDTSQLFELFDYLIQDHPQLYIQTDMRAHKNATRMKVIAELAQKLADRLSTPCPACGMPGFGVIDVERGLPCELCHMPTQSIYYDICGCVHCDFRTKKLHNPEKTTEDPGYCQWCNP